MTPAESDLAYLALERFRIYRYDPWGDLASRTGVDLQWHARGRNGRFADPLGLTHWRYLSISLQVGRTEVQMRSTLAHELVHLDRGPYLRGTEAAEERKVHLEAAKRLIDPVVYDALADVYVSREAPWTKAAEHLLRVDRHTLRAYAGWRRQVKTNTAVRAWEERKERPAWPPAWIKTMAKDYPEAAAFAGI